MTAEVSAWLGAALGNMPGGIGRVLRRVFFRRRLGGVGPGLYCETGVIVQGHENITLGAGVALFRNCALYAERGMCRIGDRTGIGINAMLDANDRGEIVIGADVLIAANTVLRASNHEYRDPGRPIREQGHTGGRIVVEDDVWIGANVVVVPDVIIGAHAIVGAGAVVTRDIPPWSIAGGVPARVLARRPGAPAELAV